MRERLRRIVERVRYMRWGFIGWMTWLLLMVFFLKDCESKRVSCNAACAPYKGDPAYGECYCDNTRTQPDAP